MSTKFRAGVIGCGSISGNHIGGYLNCGRYEVVALADLNESAMQDADTQKLSWTFRRYCHVIVRHRHNQAIDH